MKRYLLNLLFFLCLSSGVFSQSFTSDSLRNLLVGVPQDTQRVNLLNRLVLELSYGEKHEALERVEEAIALSEELGYDEGRNKAYQLLGTIYLDKGDLDSAEIFFHLAREYYENEEVKDELAQVYRRLGQVQTERNSYNLAEKYYSQEMRLAREIGDQRLLGNAYNDWATLKISRGWHSRERDSDMSDQYFQEAIPYIYKAIDAFRSDKYERGVALAYANLAILQDELNEPDAAINSMKEAMDYFQSHNYKIYLSGAYHLLNKVMQKKGAYDSAELYLRKSLDLAEELESKIDMRNAYAAMSGLFEVQGDFEKALMYLKLRQNLDEQILAEDKQANIEELEIQYLSKKQQHDLELQAIKTGQQEWIITLGSVLVLILLMLMLNFWRMNITEKRLNVELATKSDQLKQSHDLIARQYAQITESYNEQKNLMDVVAHDLRAPLNNLKALVGLIKSSGEMNEEQILFYQKAIQVIEGGDSLINDMVSLSRFESGSRISLEQIHLNSLIAELLEIHTSYAEGKGISFEMKASQDFIYLETDLIHLTRIMDNLISNAVKFSPHGTKVKVVLTENQEAGEVLISVVDEGPGMSKEDIANAFKRFKKLSARPTAGENSTGLGLSIVKTLADKIGAKISIESVQGFGAAFHIEFKVEESAAEENKA